MEAVATSSTVAAPTAATKPAPSVPSKSDRKAYYHGLLEQGMLILKRIHQAQARGDQVEAARLSKALIAAYATLERATR